MPNNAEHRTNKRLAEDIAEATTLDVNKVQRMCPTLDDKDNLLELADIATLDKPMRVKKKKLEGRVSDLADVILKLVRHFVGLVGLQALRDTAGDKDLTDDQLAKEITKLTNLKPKDVASVCPSLADKKRLVALLNITYSRMPRKVRVAELERHIDDLDEVILKLVRRKL
jgi:hypothetical protein